jgi:hypothetical protein
MLKRDDMALSLPNGGKLDGIFHRNDVSTTSLEPRPQGTRVSVKRI